MREKVKLFVSQIRDFLNYRFEVSIVVRPIVMQQSKPMNSMVERAEAAVERLHSGHPTGLFCTTEPTFRARNETALHYATTDVLWSSGRAREEFRRRFNPIEGLN